MMRLMRSIQTLSEGGSYQHEVLRFLDEIIEVLTRIEGNIAITEYHKENKHPKYGGVMPFDKQTAMYQSIAGDAARVMAGNIDKKIIEEIICPSAKVLKVARKRGRPFSKKK